LTKLEIIGRLFCQSFDRNSKKDLLKTTMATAHFSHLRLIRARIVQSTVELSRKPKRKDEKEKDMKESLIATMAMVALAVFSFGGMSFAGSTAPLPAVLEAPLGVIKDTNPSYTWTAIPDATWYRLWVVDSANRTTDLWYRADQAGCPTGATKCTATPSAVLSYGWAVCYILTWNTSGSVWSEPMHFKVSSGIPGKATIFSQPMIKTTTPAYTWLPSYGATWYRLWVGDASGNVLLDHWYKREDAVCSSGIGTCTVTPTVALPLDWAVSYVYSYNEFGAVWSDGMWFKVINP
jgi:hypothetical protein